MAQQLIVGAIYRPNPEKYPAVDDGEHHPGFLGVELLVQRNKGYSKAGYDTAVQLLVNPSELATRLGWEESELRAAYSMQEHTSRELPEVAKDWIECEWDSAELELVNPELTADNLRSLIISLDEYELALIGAALLLYPDDDKLALEEFEHIGINQPASQALLGIVKKLPSDSHTLISAMTRLKSISPLLIKCANSHIT